MTFHNTIISCSEEFLRSTPNPELYNVVYIFVRIIEAVASKGYFSFSKVGLLLHQKLIRLPCVVTADFLKLRVAWVDSNGLSLGRLDERASTCEV